MASLRRDAVGRAVEILREVPDGREHGVGSEAAQRAERAELHRLAEILDDGDITRDILAGDDLVDRLAPAHRADAAGRALAATLDAAELHGEAGLVAHVDGVVEHHDAAMADQAVPG